MYRRIRFFEGIIPQKEKSDYEESLDLSLEISVSCADR